MVLRRRRPREAPAPVAPESEPPLQALSGIPFPSWLEYPTPGAALRTHSVFIQGWIAVPRSARVERVSVQAGPERFALRIGPRPDLKAVHATEQLIGFQGSVDVNDRVAGTEWDLELVADGTEHRSPLFVAPDVHEVAASRASRRRKLDRLEPLLECPAITDAGARCAGRLTREEEALHCSRCATRYPYSATTFDFLSPELRGLAQISLSDSVSGLDYDEQAQEIIARHPDGLILDNGSGYRPQSLDNVVNLEIMDLPNTDVLGIGESLPFADATFDGVFSIAVLEHVRDPFRCAAEIARVTKPGGTIYVSVPFLQPYHGYPHHYYNMTRTGLERLFEHQFQIERSETPWFGHPVFSLTWYLNSYVHGLPPEVAAQFINMTVKELMEPGLAHFGRGYVEELSADAQLELACVNSLVATRR